METANVERIFIMIGGDVGDRRSSGSLTYLEEAKTVEDQSDGHRTEAMKWAQRLLNRSV